jgi:hypothetical protein
MSSKSSPFASRCSGFARLSALSVLFASGVACEGEEENADGAPYCAPQGDVAGEAGCCETLLVDFTNTCMPCVPLGEMRGIDGPGCCEGLEVLDPAVDDLTCSPAP